MGGPLLHATPPKTKAGQGAAPGARLEPSCLVWSGLAGPGRPVRSGPVLGLLRRGRATHRRGAPAGSGAGSGTPPPRRGPRRPWRGPGPPGAAPAGPRARPPRAARGRPPSPRWRSPPGARPRTPAPGAGRGPPRPPSRRGAPRAVARHPRRRGQRLSRVRGPRAEQRHPGSAPGRRAAGGFWLFNGVSLGRKRGVEGPPPRRAYWPARSRAPLRLASGGGRVLSLARPRRGAEQAGRA